MNAARSYELDEGATVAPLLPLALLESIRAHDRPSEVLEDENLSASLPRRLGLTDVILTQIRQYEEAHRKRRRVPVDPVADLLRLILRRPDAAAIFREAGQNVARRQFSRRPMRLRIMPRALRFASLRRAAVKTLRRIAVNARIERLPGAPLHLRVTGGIIATADSAGVACLIYEGAIQQLALLYTGSEINLTQVACVRDGAPACEWQATR